MNFIEARTKVLEQFRRLAAERRCVDGVHCPTRTSASEAGGVTHHFRYLYPHMYSDPFNAGAKITDRLYYSPIDIPVQMTVDGVVVIHSTPAAGNLYTALYSATNEAPVNRLAISALTACNGANRKQCVPFTASLQIDAGYYFIAGGATNNTDAYLCGVNPGDALGPAGMAHGPNYYFENNALPPPATATPTVATYGIDTVLTLAMFLRVASVP